MPDTPGFKFPSYVPTVNPGDTRRRIWRNTNENPLNAYPSASFHEQEVIRTSDGKEVVLSDSVVRNLNVAYTDPSTVIKMKNPVDDSLLGSLTFAEVYTVIYSLGRYAQEMQDLADEAAYLAAAQAAAAEAAAQAAIEAEQAAEQAAAQAAADARAAEG